MRLVTVLVAVIAGLTGLAGCGSGGDDDGATAEAEPTTTDATGDETGASAGSTMTTAATTTTAPASTIPEGSVKVPLDEDLLARLPQIEGGGRRVDRDEAFDERFCDGAVAPEVPARIGVRKGPIALTRPFRTEAIGFLAPKLE